MVGLRAKVLGRLGRKPSPHPRACALSCPSPAIYGPGYPSFAGVPRPLAEWREMVDVELGTNILGLPKAAYDVGINGPRTEIVVNGYEDDTYENVARQMCRALAVLGFRGEVRLFCEGGAEEEKREIFANVGHLIGTLQLTDDDAARVAA